MHSHIFVPFSPNLELTGRKDGHYYLRGDVRASYVYEEINNLFLGLEKVVKAVLEALFKWRKVQLCCIVKGGHPRLGFGDISTKYGSTVS